MQGKTSQEKATKGSNRKGREEQEQEENRGGRACTRHRGDPRGRTARERALETDQGATSNWQLVIGNRPLATNSNWQLTTRSKRRRRERGVTMESEPWIWISPCVSRGEMMVCMSPLLPSPSTRPLVPRAENSSSRATATTSRRECRCSLDGEWRRRTTADISRERVLYNGNTRMAQLLEYDGLRTLRWRWALFLPGVRPGKTGG